jgi:hypothetical protein
LPWGERFAQPLALPSVLCPTKAPNNGVKGLWPRSLRPCHSKWCLLLSQFSHIFCPRHEQLTNSWLMPVFRLSYEFLRILDTSVSSMCCWYLFLSLSLWWIWLPILIIVFMFLSLFPYVLSSYERHVKTSFPILTYFPKFSSNSLIFLPYLISPQLLWTHLYI